MQHKRSLNILILGLNYSPELVGIAVYTSGLAESLAARGHRVGAVVGKPYYPDWNVPKSYRGGWLRRSQENGVDLTRVAHYVPKSPSGTRRILHHVSFALSALLPALAKAAHQRPDLVITVAPSLIASPVARLCATISGAKCWLHLQDFEVEAAMATGLMPQGGIGERAAFWFERRFLNMFDRLSTISPAMCRKLTEKGVPPKRVIELRNWADLDGIVPHQEPSPFRKEWKISAPHVALYSGNISNKQGLEIVLGAARKLKHRKDLVFIVCGNGANRANLEAAAEDLENIRFHDLQPKERLNDLLNLASVHLLPQLAGAADLVLPSKLTNMLASGRPVIATADADTALAEEVKDCGLVVEPEDEPAFTAAIEQILDDAGARSTYGQAALQRARERWNRQEIINRFEAQLQELVHGKKEPSAQLSLGEVSQ